MARRGSCGSGIPFHVSASSIGKPTLSGRALRPSSGLHRPVTPSRFGSRHSPCGRSAGAHHRHQSANRCPSRREGVPPCAPWGCPPLGWITIKRGTPRRFPVGGACHAFWDPDAHALVAFLDEPFEVLAQQQADSLDEARMPDGRRPTSQWPRLEAGYSDDLGTADAGAALPPDHCH